MIRQAFTRGVVLGVVGGALLGVGGAALLGPSAPAGAKGAALAFRAWRGCSAGVPDLAFGGGGIFGACFLADGEHFF